MRAQVCAAAQGRRGCLTRNSAFLSCLLLVFCVRRVPAAVPTPPLYFSGACIHRRTSGARGGAPRRQLGAPSLVLLLQREAGAKPGIEVQEARWIFRT